MEELTLSCLADRIEKLGKRVAEMEQRMDIILETSIDIDQAKGNVLSVVFDYLDFIDKGKYTSLSDLPKLNKIYCDLSTHGKRLVDIMKKEGLWTRKT